MKDIDIQKKPEYVRKMFQRVARNYDRMNSLMTANQDKIWRREVIKQAELKPGMFVLDLGSGTGDLARMIVKQYEDIKTIAADFTMEMMLAGLKKGVLPYTAADAQDLPFSNNSFDAVVSGFLVRNVSDLEKALSEQYRVIKPGGKVVILDTTKPTQNILTPFIWIYMHLAIPLLGAIISGNREAYQYLPASSENFLLAEDLVERMKQAGFSEVRFRRYMAGTVAIHWGKKVQ